MGSKVCVVAFCLMSIKCPHKGYLHWELSFKSEMMGCFASLLLSGVLFSSEPLVVNLSNEGYIHNHPIYQPRGNCRVPSSSSFALHEGLIACKGKKWRIKSIGKKRTRWEPPCLWFKRTFMSQIKNNKKNKESR